MPPPAEIRFRVRYAETDQMGVERHPCEKLHSWYR